jgi:hypothetical protein
VGSDIRNLSVSGRHLKRKLSMVAKGSAQDARDKPSFPAPAEKERLASGSRPHQIDASVALAQ